MLKLIAWELLPKGRGIVCVNSGKALLLSAPISLSTFAGGNVSSARNIVEILGPSIKILGNNVVAGVNLVHHITNVEVLAICGISNGNCALGCKGGVAI